MPTRSNPMRLVFRSPGAARCGALALLASLVGGCYTSPHPDTLDFATGPRGVSGEIWFRDDSRARVELLEVGDSAYVVVRDGRVVVVPYGAVDDASFETVGLLQIGAGRVPSAGLRERLRLLSRYPFGLPEPARVELLRAAGQVAPDTVRAARRR
jgi:hypothetical protein